MGGIEGTQTEAFDGGEDVVGGLDPAERSRVGVDGVDVAPDGVFEFLGRAMDPAPELLFGQEREEALDLVEPGGAGGREVDMPAGMAGQPTLDSGRLVGCVVVHDQMDVADQQAAAGEAVTCCSARRLDADRRGNMLIRFDSEGSIDDAEQHLFVTVLRWRLLRGLRYPGSQSRSKINHSDEALPWNCKSNANPWLRPDRTKSRETSPPASMPPDTGTFYQTTAPLLYGRPSAAGR